eukprot:scaffold1171_cov177-Amphora_coffeaeformis.AAC.14
MQPQGSPVRGSPMRIQVQEKGKLPPGRWCFGFGIAMTSIISSGGIIRVHEFGQLRIQGVQGLRGRTDGGFGLQVLAQSIQGVIDSIAAGMGRQIDAFGELTSFGMSNIPKGRTFILDHAVVSNLGHLKMSGPTQQGNVVAQGCRQGVADEIGCRDPSVLGQVFQLLRRETSRVKAVGWQSWILSCCHDYAVND